MKTLAFGSGTWDPQTRVLLADGAWGTQFMKAGLPQGEAPEAWNLHNPEAVLSVARSYAQAGSDIILTNSFGASSIKLERHGLAGQAYEINKRAAQLTAQAASEASSADRQVIVGGDLGPCGKLVVMGEIEEDALYEVFSEQARALKDGGAHWLVIETMIDRSEMAVAVRAAAATGLVVAATMTYERTSVGYRTVMGDTPEDCIRTALEEGASVVGANCGAGIDSYVDLARELRALTDGPLWIKANAGLPEIVGDQTVYRMSPDAYCSYIPALLDAGVNVVGGCCGTSPEFIAQARAIVH
ncbi:MAG: homocysteine S-methyltransferase family protein [Clostridia bacterium]